MDKDYYKILGVDSSASQIEIKKAFRKLSLRFHPDHCSDSNASEKMSELNEAYGILRDVKTREEYNMMQNNPFMHMTGAGDPMQHFNQMFQEQDINDVLHIFTQNLFGGGGGSSPDIRNLAGKLHFFQNGSGSSPFMQMQKPETIDIVINIPIYDCYHGKTIEIYYEKWTIINDKKIKEDIKQNITIPPGIYNGETFTLNAQGNVVSEDNKGDVCITVHIQNDTEMVRNDDDLHLNKSLNITEALCGFEFNFDHISGNNFTLKNDPLKGGDIITPNFNKIIPGLGMKRGDKIGNLIINYTVVFPNEITEEQVESLKSIL